jgi:hypothetical protein
MPQSVSDISAPVEVPPEPAAKTANIKLEWAVLGILCVVLAAQLFFSLRHISQEADESTHLYSGYRALKCGDFSFSPEHPPLAKMIAAAPLLADRVQVDCATNRANEAKASLDWLYSQQWHKMLSHSRAAISVFAFALLIVVWLWAR